MNQRSIQDFKKNYLQQLTDDLIAPLLFFFYFIN